MKRIDEEKASENFVAKLAAGHFPCDRSVNFEVNYRNEKEQRDTDAVKAFVRSELFRHIKHQA